MQKVKVAVLDMTHQEDSHLKARPNLPMPMQGVVPAETTYHIYYPYKDLL